MIYVRVFANCQYTHSVWLPSDLRLWSSPLLTLFQSLCNITGPCLGTDQSSESLYIHVHAVFTFTYVYNG